MKAYKGFDKNLQCRGLQYEIGGTQEVDKVKLCNQGLHACEAPLDVFRYYAPGEGSRYCEVEMDGVSDERGDDSKRVAKKLTVGAEIGIPGLVKAHVEYVKAHTTMEHTDQKAATAGAYGAATAGDSGAATAGDSGAATAGYRGAATAGYRGAATAGVSGAATAGAYGAATAGDSGAATAGVSGAATAGYRGAATAGDSGAATAGAYGAATAGYRGAATAGYRGAATAGVSGAATAGAYGAATAGDSGAATAGDSGAATAKGSVSVGENGCGLVRGNDVKIKGGLGAVLVICEENADNWDIKEWKAFVVDGTDIRADTWYKLVKGKLVEAE
jgi:hypothetical protein